MDGELIHGYTVNPVPRDLDHFETVIRDSYRSSATFMNVLIIEDEPNIIEAIRFILSRDGWAVDTHSDGATALDAVERLRADGVDVGLINKPTLNVVDEEMLAKISAASERELEAATLGITSLIEPLLIVIMGFLVGFIVLSILLPIFEMNQVIG